MKIFGSMGDSHTAPQDTITAYWAALGAGADGFSAGVRLTADNKVICLSHASLAETCGDQRRVTDLKAKDIARLDAGVTFRSASLDDQLQIIDSERGRDLPWRGGLRSKRAISHPLFRDVLEQLARRTTILARLPDDLPDAAMRKVVKTVTKLCTAIGVEDRVTIIGTEFACRCALETSAASRTVMIAVPETSLKENLQIAKACGASSLLVDIDDVAPEHITSADKSARQLAAMCAPGDVGLLLSSSNMPYALHPDILAALSSHLPGAAVLVRSPLHAVACRDARSLAQSDSLDGRLDRARWSAGYSSHNTDTLLEEGKGISIKIRDGGEYSGAGLVTRVTIHGRFDAQVKFRVASPANATTLEMAAIGIDPPQRSSHRNTDPGSRRANLVYDVHGAPPYASSERDEDDGFRCGWNNSHNFAQVGEDWVAKSANMFNQYGRDVGDGSKGNKSGQLRLVRNGPVFVSYYRDKHNSGWVCSGAMLVPNLSDDTYLRLAGKHWAKGGTTPPANEITFSNFKLHQFRSGPGCTASSSTTKQQPMSASPSPSEPATLAGGSDAENQGGSNFGATSAPAVSRPRPTNTKLPVEVDLVARVKGCRACKWFWGAIPPYGPYSAYSYTSGTKLSSKGTKVEAAGYQIPDPAIMHGCRKAPIMTIGINPNLGAFFASNRGAVRAYPHFKDDQSYAHYYRYKTVHQERFDLDEIRNSLIPGSEIRAKADGKLTLIDRTIDHRWMQLVFEYKGADRPEVIELSWKPDARYVVLTKGTRNNKPVNIRKGELVAGKLAPPDGKIVQVTKQKEGYYTRFVPVLKEFKSMVGDALQNAELEIGEDVAMHDMIACASPGWDKYDIPKDRVIDNCIGMNGFVISQFLQSRPKVLVIVGQTSLNMFARTMGPFIENLDYEIEDIDPKDKARPAPPRRKNIFHLLDETTARRCYVRINAGGIRFRSRILVTPHFSYRDNYTPHARLSNKAWEAFEQDLPEDARLLLVKERAEDTYDRTEKSVRIWQGKDEDGKKDDVLPQLSSAAQRRLMASYYDPTKMLAAALAEEFKRGELMFDTKQQRLSRTDGPCNFCVNDRWQFPGECAYGKPDEKPEASADYTAAVREILAAAAAAAAASSTDK